MRFRFLLLAASTLVGAQARADNLPGPPGRADPTAAFERAYASSFYEFDACGDRLAGRLYRRALTDKVTACPFPADAKAYFRQRSALMRAKGSDMLDALIEQHNGLPVRLDGMTRTCHEQMTSPEYRAVRGRLTDYAAGRTATNDVVSDACDAAEITP